MAAHDDKISNNRRRLFKALSAAPVVMTLRPGTAAASSAYQCLANPTNPVNLNDVDTCAVGDDACWLYESGKEYWLGAQQQIRNQTLYDGLSTSDKSWFTAGAVYLQSAIDPTKIFLWDETVPAATEIMFEDSGIFLNVGPGGNYLRLRGPDANGDTRTIIRFPTRLGVALKLFDPIDKNGVSTPGNSTTNPPIGVVESPDVVPDAWSHKDGSNLQGLAATCMTSVDPNGTITNFVLNKG